MSSSNDYFPGGVDDVIATIRGELESTESSGRDQLLEKLVMAALGSVPWVGGFLAAAIALNTESRSGRADQLRKLWLEEHQKKLHELRQALDGMFERISKLGDDVKQRSESDEYLALVRRTFRQWDEADTDAKRKHLLQLITNAVGLRECSDDIIRLFLNWLDVLHEAHLAVVKEIFQRPGPTRMDIWEAIYGGALPRDDSSQADLFKMLIRDLSTAGVIRQAREADDAGRFYRRPQRKPNGVKRHLESAFENTKPYVVTELGKQFVHYTMNELVGRLNSGAE